jgi:hypothetical protein
MNASAEMIEINVVVALPASVLQAIVANTKAVKPPDSNGRYRVDMADRVSAMISNFLLAKDFEAYVSDLENYRF